MVSPSSEQVNAGWLADSRMITAFLVAAARREPLRRGVHGPTDALRLLDGAGDGPEFRGLFVEDYSGRWLALTDGRGPTGPPAWLREAMAQAPTPARSLYWKRLDVREQPAPVHVAGEEITAPFEAVENGLRLGIDFAAGYSQGVFLDQRDNRRRVRDWCAARPGAEVLNCFAYTGAFSVAAALGGARTATADLSRRYLDWARDNFARNGIDPGAHEFLAGDVFDWLRRLLRQGRAWDLVILDPPTFSRPRGGKPFQAGRDFDRLAAQAAELVRPGGALLCSTNYRGLDRGGLRRMIHGALGRGWRLDALPMGADFPGDPYLQAVWAERC